MDNPEVLARIQTKLQTTPYAASSLQLLAGGYTNFIYAARLKKPLEDGTDMVAWKHGEAYLATSVTVELTIDRCLLEGKVMEYIQRLPPLKTTYFTIQTPKFYHFDGETDTLVQEMFQNATSLKTYVLKSGKLPLDTSLEDRYYKLGRALGQWLRSFHDWGRQPENQELRQMVSSIKSLQWFKHTVNYKVLVDKVDKYPDILSESREIFKQVCEAAKVELEDTSKLEIIHGDFWTGNILLPDESLEGRADVPLRIVDWEMAQLGLPELDVGECVAELWQMVIFKDLDQGRWISSGLLHGYGPVSEEFVFRTITHVGTHFITLGEAIESWGTPDQRKGLVRTGRDAIRAAWGRDRAYLKNDPLGRLFGEILVK